MLKTPLGDIIVSVDDISIEYTAVPVLCDKRYPDLNGRYYICIVMW